MLNRRAIQKLMPPIADFFSLGIVTKIKKAPASANINFFIKTSRGHFFVKINLEPHTLDNKLTEVKYLEHIINAGIPATPYLIGENGSPILEIGQNMIMVQNVIPGYNPSITRARISEVARYLGKLSLVPINSLPYRYGWLSPEYVEKNLEKISGSSEAREILASYHSCQKFVEIISPKLPYSIIHGDLHSENVIFKNGHLAAIVDWEDSTIAPSLFDFVSSVAYWCSKDGTINNKSYENFYSNYTRERPLTKLEINSLEDCMAYVGVIQTMWRFLNCEGSPYDRLWGLKLRNWKAPRL